MTRNVSGRAAFVMTVFLATGTPARADWQAPLAAGYRALSAGKLAEAEAQMKQAVAMAKRLGAERDHEYAEALVGLSDVYLAQGKPTLAGAVLGNAFGILAESPHAGVEVLAHLHTSLSRVRASEGRMTEAQALLKYVLAYQEKALGPNDVRVADTLDSLARLSLLNRQGPDGADYERRALDVRVRAAGNAPGPLTDALLKLAAYEDSQDSHAAAKSVRRRALAVQEKSLGPNHPDVADTLMAIATADVSVGESGGLAVTERAFSNGYFHFDALESSKFRARAIALFLEGKPLAERALAIREKALGADHPKTIATLDFLAAGYAVQQDDAHAEPYLRRVVEARTKTLGPQSVKLFTRLGALSRVYMRHGQYAEAFPILERVVAINEAKARPSDAPPPLVPTGPAYTLSGIPQTRSDEDDPDNYQAQLRKAIRLAGEAAGVGRPAT